MRLASFAINGSQRWGFVRPDGNLVDAAEHCDPLDPTRLEWLPPVRRPGKIIGVALNHPEWMKQAVKPFTQPALFLKAPSALVGHGAAIEVAQDFGLTHPEPELAVIIGSVTKNIAPADALSAIFGYAIVNDVTSPGLKDQDSIQLENNGKGPQNIWRRAPDGDTDVYSTYLARAKSSDSFAPMGPYLASADEIQDPDNLNVKAWLGDKQYADDNTGNLIFGVAEVIAHASRTMTLHPGDIIMMGTAAMPVDIGIKQADMTKLQGPSRIEIEGLGVLENPIQVA
ncbi:MAG: fumarylacetoacetate hydrolase family protein [Alphaproteobacteria bacterium]